MPIGDYCQRNVVSTQPQIPLREAARLMAEEGVGALPVVWQDKVTGIVTDRDIALAVLAGDQDPGDAVVGDLCRVDAPTCVHETAPLGIAAALMRRHAVRRLPVVDEDDRLVGILTSDDVLRLVAGELGGLAKAVSSQAPGIGEDPRALTAADILRKGDA